jgi:methylmalonyl-CoA mutase cobalamin-binding subunit
LKRDYGIAGVFGPGTSTNDIVEFIRNNVKPERFSGAEV